MLNWHFIAADTKFIMFIILQLAIDVMYENQALKSCYFPRVFLEDSIVRCKARGRLVLQRTALVFSEGGGEFDFRFSHQKWLLGNIQYIASFKLKSLK